MHKSYIAKTFWVPWDCGSLEGKQLRFGIHYFFMVLPYRCFGLIQDGKEYCSLEGPREVAVILSLHCVDKKGYVVRTALGSG